MKSSLPFSSFVDQCRKRANSTLSVALPKESELTPLLLEAMNYCVFNGGKRIRSTLAYAACHAFNGDVEQANPVVCAIELMHAYSLIHDDLPAMDNDDLRRGMPSCHKAYDEATAILVGDALQSLSFEVLASKELFPESHLSDSSRVTLIKMFGQASGLTGMVGGQAMDQLATGSILTREQLELMHSGKTGALIRASIHMGAMCARPLSEQEQVSLNHYAKAIGLAFQVQDDILDVTAETKMLGKHQGSDIALNKPTYVSLLGLEQAIAYAKELHHTAISALSQFKQKADYLRRMADYIVNRSY